MENPLDIQVGGDHYKKFKIQPIEFLDSVALPSSLSYAIKYLSRIGIEKDSNNIGLDKAIHCLEISKVTMKNYSYLYHLTFVDGQPHKSGEFVAQFENEDVREIISTIMQAYNQFRFEKDQTIPYQRFVNRIDYAIKLIEELKKKGI